MEIRYLTYLIQNIQWRKKYILYNGDSVESFTYVERWKYNGVFHNEITNDKSLFENVIVSNEVITGALVKCFEDGGIYTYMDASISSSIKTNLTPCVKEAS